MRILLPFVIFILMGWVFLFHPAGIAVFGNIFIILIVSVLVAAFAFIFYASWRQKEGNPIKGVTVSPLRVSHVPTAFVGLAGSGAALSVRHEQGRITVGLSPFTYAWITAVLFIFGPVFIALFLRHEQTFLPGLLKGPKILMVMLPAMVLLATFFFVYYLREMLWRTPHIVVTPDAIRFRRGQKQEAVIWQRDISYFEIGISPFIMDQGAGFRTIDNYTLTVVPAQGTPRGLCITDNRNTTEALKAEMERMLNVSPSQNPPLPEQPEG